MKIFYTNNTDENISPLMNYISEDVEDVDEYDGNFVDLLHAAPHMAAFNVNDYNLASLNLTMMYNDTMQHSLPILVNIISKAMYR